MIKSVVASKRTFFKGRRLWVWPKGHCGSKILLLVKEAVKLKRLLDLVSPDYSLVSGQDLGDLKYCSFCGVGGKCVERVW